MTKRLFDLSLALLLGTLLVFPIGVLWILVSLETKSNGLFSQQRIGQYGAEFTIYKLKTIVWKDKEAMVTRLGAYLRKYKIDEWPQLYNIVNGTMSFVGPRPDLEGFYDDLRGEERKVLLLKPGLTSRASIAFFNEERLLQTQDDPIKYNKEIIFPKKVTMNLDYYHHRSFVEDLKVIKETLKCFYKT